MKAVGIIWLVLFLLAGASMMFATVCHDRTKAYFEKHRQEFSIAERRYVAGWLIWDGEIITTWVSANGKTYTEATTIRASDIKGIGDGR